MSAAFRFFIALACSVLSLPGAFLLLLVTVAATFESCHVGLSGWACQRQHLAAAVMSVAAVVAWMAYFSMALSWVAHKPESRVTLNVGTGAVACYFALGVWAVNGNWQVALAGGALPVLPAMLLACYLLWYFRRSGHAATAPERQAG